jgi:MerR family transcriptional regulator, copper efflux regulator
VVNLDTTLLRFAGVTDVLTINEAAVTTGWSPRMLRYLERVGLVEAARTPAGYRVFGPPELQRLRTLRELLDRHDCGLSEVAFAKRLREDAGLNAAITHWFEAPVERPQGVSSSEEWLNWEQEKHQRLLASAA